MQKRMIAILVACLSITPTAVLGTALTWESSFDYQVTSSVDTQAETQMAVSPTNTNLVVTAVINIIDNTFPIPDVIRCHIYRSADGGQMWSFKYEIPLTSGSNKGDDPSVTVDKNGKFYVACRSVDAGDFSPSDIVLASSTDGNTWTTTTVVQGFDNQDYPQIRADTSNNPTTQNRVYLCWSRIVTTTDTIKFKQIVPNNDATLVDLASGSTARPHGCVLDIDSNGGVYATWMRFTSSSAGREEIRRNFDVNLNPSSWTASVNVKTFTRFPSCAGWDFGCVNGYNSSVIRVHNFPFTAVDSGNAVNVAYADYSATNGGEIKYTRSTNCGNGGSCTWSSTISINNDGTSRDQWEPMIAASKKSSTVHVTAYDRRDDTGNISYKPFHYHCHIADNCALQSSWYNVKVSDNGGTNLDSSMFNGEYHGVASSTAREAYTVWTDHRVTNPTNNYDIWGDRTTT
ncbi:MAG: hypothetical protein HMLIMOIP_002532 [Candidatus Nitrosomirales archaeon]|jgi:hypothetical protein